MRKGGLIDCIYFLDPNLTSVKNNKIFFENIIKHNEGKRRFNKIEKEYMEIYARLCRGETRKVRMLFLILNC